MGKIDEAGRAIAGLLTYNPGPGIYSRLERAIEAMPDNVRTQELPGLLKRYKDGVPGWELKATDLDSTIAGRDVVPKSELLAAVKERSPVYTHQEVILGGRPQIGRETVWPEDSSRPSHASVVERQSEPSPLGGGVSHGKPQYESYGQGGKDYSELLLIQPGAQGERFGSHWMGGVSRGDLPNAGAVAHARFDTHGDALRINELQSDLGIHNRKAREGSLPARQQLPSESDSDYADAMLEEGHAVDWDDDGNVVVSPKTGLPFPLEDAWSDLLIKRLALEAARKGHRAIEIASPRAIADKVGGNIDNYEHFYGKVVPGALERLGRKMGGLVDDTASTVRPSYTDVLESLWKRGPDEWAAANAFDRIQEMERSLNARFPSGKPYGRVGMGETVGHVVLDAPWDPSLTMKEATHLRDVLWGDFERAGHSFEDAERLANAKIGEVLYDASKMKELSRQHHTMGQQLERKAEAIRNTQAGTPPGRRYIMSDEMRKRILTQGIGASLLAPVAAEEE